MYLINLNTASILLAVHAVLAITSAGHALLYKKDPRAALGWIAVCLAYPLVGPLMYYLFGINRLRTRGHVLKGAPAKRLKLGYERSDNILTSTKETLPAVLAGETELAALARSSAAVTHSPLLEKNTLLPFFYGDSAYAAMLNAIAQSRHSVCLASYIFVYRHPLHNIYSAIVSCLVESLHRDRLLCADTVEKLCI